MSDWQPYENGATLGKTGSEGGVIIRDDEHIDGARLTVERGCLRAPFALTCGLYGWMVHTRFFADDETAQHAAAQMKTALAEILALIPDQDDPDEAEKLDGVTNAISEFIERFP